MWDVEHTDTFIRVILVVAPIGVYFFLLGLLNSRRHPQLLSGRRDFTILLLALAPLFLIPALSFTSALVIAIVITASGVGLAILLLRPPSGRWVIYNISPDQARHAVIKALVKLGENVRTENGRLKLIGWDATVKIEAFALLHNVSVRLTGGDKLQAKRFEDALARILGGVRARTRPMASAFLLISTVMLLAPVAMVVHRVPEMVRIITDLLY